MNLRELGERGFIDGIRRRLGALAPPPPGGIGDDAAILSHRRSALLVSTDCLIERQHFHRHEPPFLLGRKSLAVNLSDIAAMGGRPDSFLLTLAVPRNLPAGYLDRFLDGIVSSAREHSVKLIGGDTSASPGPLIISITIFGSAVGARRRAALTRGGARVGDGIYLSGALGGSAAGRLLLDAGWRPLVNHQGGLRGAAPPARPVLKGAERRRLVTRAGEALKLHLDPTPRLALGGALLRGRIASAAMDVSDGLSMDLSRMAEASAVGARVVAPAVPIADAARALAPSVGSDPLALALHGGEDYELLFTAPASQRLRLSRLKAVWIGQIVPRRQGLVLVDASGRREPLRVSGFDHFRPR